jgi:hypothetical protein
MSYTPHRNEHTSLVINEKLTQEPSVILENTLRHAEKGLQWKVVFDDVV